MKLIRFGKNELDNPSRVRRIKNILKKFTPIILILAIFTLMTFFLAGLSGSSSIVNLILKNGSILKSSSGKVNVLLLGIAGGTHQGATLTDTIVIASYNLKTNQVYLISIPRDLWLPSLQTKVNAVYQTGLNQDNGLGLTKTVVGNILGLPIHYAVRVDFSGFVKAVDTLGGVDVVVDRSFDDYHYPIEGKENDLCGWEEKEIDFNEEEAKKLNIEIGKRKVLVKGDAIATDSADLKKGPIYFSCRFEHVLFKAGPTHLDGKTALKFVRSRQGLNGEGSDFARSKRQQKVLDAIRDKVLSLGTLTNPTKVSELLDTFGKSIDTDISLKDTLEFYRLLSKVDKTYSFVLDDRPMEGLEDGRLSLLVSPSPDDYGGAYVLIAQDDDFSTIHTYVRKILAGEVTDEATSSARTSY